MQDAERRAFEVPLAKARVLGTGLSMLVPATRIPARGGGQLLRGNRVAALR